MTTDNDYLNMMTQSLRLLVAEIRRVSEQIEGIRCTLETINARLDPKGDPRR